MDRRHLGIAVTCAIALFAALGVVSAAAIGPPTCVLDHHESASDRPPDGNSGQRAPADLTGAAAELGRRLQLGPLAGPPLLLDAHELHGGNDVVYARTSSQLMAIQPGAALLIQRAGLVATATRHVSPTLQLIPVGRHIGVVDPATHEIAVLDSGLQTVQCGHAPTAATLWASNSTHTLTTRGRALAAADTSGDSAWTATLDAAPVAIGYTGSAYDDLEDLGRDRLRLR